MIALAASLINAFVTLTFAVAVVKLVAHVLRYVRGLL